jgi:pyruvate dehydrogenase E2 component (dihydrolipoamide acetyltransferase)
VSKQSVVVTNSIDIKISNLGNITDAEVIEVLVKVGDRVECEDSLITLETEKAVMEVPATNHGIIEELTIAIGDKVSSEDVIGRMVIEIGDTVVITPASEAIEVTPEQITVSLEEPSLPPKLAEFYQTSAELPMIEETGFLKAHASPSVRKLARELGVDLTQVRGSGVKNRIMQDDVKAFVKSILSEKISVGGVFPKVPSIDFSKFGEIESKPLTRIQKISSKRLQASWINLPHVTQHDLADVTNLEKKRQELKGSASERDISLTPLSFILKACIIALQKFPKVNSSLSEDGKFLIQKNYYHLGFAADTEGGLMVPVIHDANKKNVYELATELGHLSALAHEGKLKLTQLHGASFTVSSLGGIGGTAFTPIINAPEVAILGVSRSSIQPVWNGSKFEPRLMLPFSLSYDHRAIDGAYAALFTTFLSKILSNVDDLLEDMP